MVASDFYTCMRLPSEWMEAIKVCFVLLSFCGFCEFGGFFGLGDCLR